jgi:hypothetical protein
MGVAKGGGCFVLTIARDEVPRGCDGTTAAQTRSMIRIALLLATIVPLTACLGPSRSPGRLGGTLATLAGAALAAHAATSDCEELGCTLMPMSVGNLLLIVGVPTLIINEVRYIPPVDGPTTVRTATHDTSRVSLSPPAPRTTLRMR